jgi:hypothetical protein
LAGTWNLEDEQLTHEQPKIDTKAQLTISHPIQAKEAKGMSVLRIFNRISTNGFNYSPISFFSPPHTSPAEMLIPHQRGNTSIFWTGDPVR